MQKGSQQIYVCIRSILKSKNAPARGVILMPRQMRSEMPSGFSEETAASREKRWLLLKNTAAHKNSVRLCRDGWEKEKAFCVGGKEKKKSFAGKI